MDETTPPLQNEPIDRGISNREIRALRRSRLIEGLDPDENVVVVIHRHPLGLLPAYLWAVVGYLSLAAIAGYLIPQLMSVEQRSQATSALAVFLVIAAVIAAVGLVVATYVYGHNRLIITNKNVTQISQNSLFGQKVSELSMSNVEDVSAHQSGILQTLFGYGTLRIQTAGERDNFMFIYCPQPNYYGRIISDARQQYADSLSEDNHPHHVHGQPSLPPVPAPESSAAPDIR